MIVRQTLQTNSSRKITSHHLLTPMPSRTLTLTREIILHQQLTPRRRTMKLYMLQPYIRVVVNIQYSVRATAIVIQQLRKNLRYRIWMVWCSGGAIILGQIFVLPSQCAFGGKIHAFCLIHQLRCSYYVFAIKKPSFWNLSVHLC